MYTTESASLFMSIEPLTGLIECLLLPYVGFWAGLLACMLLKVKIRFRLTS